MTALVRARSNTITSSVQLKEILVVGLKGLGAKTK
jgi:hypothetical protein